MKTNISNFTNIVLVTTLLLSLGCQTASKSEIQATEIQNSCESEVKKNLLSILDVPDENILDSYIKLDCDESRKISDISSPYSDAKEINKAVGEFLNYLINDSLNKWKGFLNPFSGVDDAENTNFNNKDYLKYLPDGLIENWTRLTLPYCRVNHEWFGSFCMASDIHAAEMMLERKDLIEQIPSYIVKLAKIAEEDGVLSPISKIGGESISEDQILIMSFILLDDNGVQTSRLMANLLYKKDYKTYAKLFPYLVDIWGMAFKDGRKPGANASSVFYATRTGKFTVDDIVEKEHKLTYKVFSGVYLGCQLKKMGHKRFTTGSLSSLAATSYEFVKLADLFELPSEERIERVKYIWKKSEKSREMMKSGALFGFDRCKISEGN